MIPDCAARTALHAAAPHKTPGDPMFKPLLSTAFGLAALALSTNAFSAAQLPLADQQQFKAHLLFLADDVMEGRDTGARGYDIAANYVASQFMQVGLLPKGEGVASHPYLQAVPFKTARLVAESAVFELIGKQGAQKLAFPEEFTMSGSLMEDQSSVTAPLVFAGYGIDAPMFQHRDFDGLDVKGKIVVVLQGNPDGFPTEEGSHFGNPQEKQAAAFARGAVGFITVATPKSEKRRPFAAGRNFATAAVFGWVSRDGRQGSDLAGLQNRASVSMETAKKLFAQSGVTAEAVFAAVEAGKPVPRMDLNLSAHLEKKSTRQDVASSNVVGLLEGSDPVLKNEYVVFSAHLDHLGVRTSKTGGDSIYNGAMDNASGVATLIETARLFTRNGQRPKRSILFVALTGEEKGLLGSDFFARNPTVPGKNIVADINLDMPLLTYDFNTVVAFGAEHSSLKNATTNALRKLNLTLTPDPFPEQSIFTRSDHYNFVRQGVPSVFLATGMGSFNKDENAKALWDEFFAKYYHKPGDDLSLPFNFTAAARFVDVNYMIGTEIANDKARPTWNKGDFFGDTFRRN
jgi:Zn-dependent M28 family amino/carboxypeptidase